MTTRERYEVRRRAIADVRQLLCLCAKVGGALNERQLVEIFRDVLDEDRDHEREELRLERDAGVIES